ncbi:hypothetical protein B0A49_07029, partial [Cryomyces minteri]
MLIEKLPLPIPIHADVRIQTHDLAAPELLPLLLSRSVIHTILISISTHFHTEYQVSQPSLPPQPLRECCVIDLKAVVDSHCIALFWLPGGR